MMARELLEELKSIRRNFDWYYYGSARKIRGRLKSQPGDVLFDPIGAVCYFRTGVSFGESDWLRAAEALELSHIDAGDLTAAANNVTHGQGQVYTQNLRRQMIDGVLLEVEFAERSTGTRMIAGFLPTLLRRKAHGGAKS